MIPEEEFLLRPVVDELARLALSAAPYEACGLLEWDGARMTVHSLLNISEEPTTSFLVDPYEQRHVLAAILERGTELWALWHSHPSEGARPSERDRHFARAIGNTLRWVIVGLEPDDGEPEIWYGRP